MGKKPSIRKYLCPECKGDLNTANKNTEQESEDSYLDIRIFACDKCGYSYKTVARIKHNMQQISK